MGKKSSEKNRKGFSKFKKKKHRSRSVSSSSSSSLSSIDEETKKKLKKKLKKLRKKEKLNKKRKEKKTLKKLVKSKLLEESLSSVKKTETVGPSCDVDSNLTERSKSLAPMTREEWEKQQNTFKRVLDKETGRMRLVKGTGEIVEECVSRERHLAINKQATRGDGEFFQRKLMQHLM